jgi:hypothetical protein
MPKKSEEERVHRLNFCPDDDPRNADWIKLVGYDVDTEGKEIVPIIVRKGIAKPIPKRKRPPEGEEAEED